MAFLETVHLNQAQNRTQILRDVNLKVEKGEFLALIGPTGAGKTTLLRLLNMLESPESGKLLIDGTDVTEIPGGKLQVRRRMAFVLQKPVVFNMSVFDNVAIGLKWHGIDKNESKERTESILNDIGLYEYRKRNARTLSGGETQRVAIARALITRPEILLLDEPGANLDPVTSLSVEEFLTEAVRRFDITTVMATHDMAQGQRMADRVAVMLNGEILQSGNWYDVFNMPKNKEIALFVGAENTIDGRITECDGQLAVIETGSGTIEAVTGYSAGDAVSVIVRPEDITIGTQKSATSARNCFAGTIKKVITFGALTRVIIDCGFSLVVLVTSRSAQELDLTKGKDVFASFKATGVHVIRR